jgi:hypothetical protein
MAMQIRIGAADIAVEANTSSSLDFTQPALPQ